MVLAEFRVNLHLVRKAVEDSGRGADVGAGPCDIVARAVDC